MAGAACVPTARSAATMGMVAAIGKCLHFRRLLLFFLAVVMQRHRPCAFLRDTSAQVDRDATYAAPGSARHTR